MRSELSLVVCAAVAATAVSAPDPVPATASAKSLAVLPRVDAMTSRFIPLGLYSKFNNVNDFRCVPLAWFLKMMEL